MKLLVACVLVAGCASAGSGDRPDASGGGKQDGSIIKMDAALQIDAPSMSTGCTSSQQCTSAMMLGNVSGDSGNAKLTAQGYQSAWYRVRVTEDNSTVVPLTLRMAARVTSPPGMTFHVATYVNTGSNAVECATTVGSPTTAGNTEEIKIEWGEMGTFSNGSDDGRDVSIEVKAPASGCSSSLMWQLEVEGNWL
ncbi:MAG TPA: hypothetical protein VMZ53_30690 [Kofleriaceae bacterium]|nr:hypothetical protein [Kofleriaceae bacterium]